MIKASVTLLSLVGSLNFARQEGPPADSVPTWLTALIQQQRKQPVANPPAHIARYDYKGQVVYYLPPRCCDIPSNVYSASGAIICHADGGLGGDGDGRCPDFYAARKNEKIIWRDARSRAGRAPDAAHAPPHDTRR